MKKFAELLRGIRAGTPLQKRDSVPVPAPLPASTRDADAAPRPDYRDQRYLRLAKQCALGDIAAMWDMAQWHRRHLRPSTAALLDDYDAGVDHYGELYTRTRYGSPDRFSLKACITWLMQAARYGNQDALRLVQGRYFYRTCGVLKEITHQVGKYGSELYYASDLHNLGLLDVDNGLTEFGMYPLTPEGIFIAYYQSDYIPADSDGFGREDDYANIFYDEFFNHIPGKTLEDARRNLPKLLKRREAYWADPKNHREHRKYRQLWSEIHGQQV